MEEQDEGVREQDDVQDDGDEQGGQEEEEELEEETSIMEEGDQLDDSVREAAANQGPMHGLLVFRRVEEPLHSWEF
eukprot:1600467-Rhodomonas_salina.3